MNNSRFLDVLKESFSRYIETGSRSNKKLINLHGTISADLLGKLNDANNSSDEYSIASLGFGAGKEKKINGRYMEKTIDVIVNKNGMPVAGIGVKSVMRNYQQNSNNYFENMLGETANVRCTNLPYFQIFIISDKTPKFEESGRIREWERINEHNIKKYIALSNDNDSLYFHTPNKTLIYIIKISNEEPPGYSDWKGYAAYYKNEPFSVMPSDKTFSFGKNVIYNDYEEFIKKVVYTILSL